MAPELKEREARQGFWDRPVLYVLAGALVLAAVYLAVLTGWTVFQTDAEIADVGATESDSTPVEVPNAPASGTDAPAATPTTP